MAILQRTLKTKNNKFGIKKPKLEEIDLSKNTIFIFPGSGADDEQNANGYCKIVEQMISKDVANIYSFYYDDPPKEEEIFNNFIKEDISKNYRGKFSVGLNEKQQNEFVEKIMVPLFFKDGEILHEEKAKEHFSKITFFSHCHGMKEVSIALNKTAAIMEEKGYKKEQIKNILSSVKNISYAPHINKNTETEFGIHIKFCSTKDNFFGDYWKKKYNKDGSYLGIGKTFLEDNSLTMLSDNFGGMNFNTQYNIAIPIGCDDHQINTVQVYDEDGPYQMEKDRGEQSQRILALYEIISMCLSLSLVDKNADLNIFDELIKNQIRITKTLESEKIDSMVFLNGNPKKKFEEFLEHYGVTEKELLNGEKTLKDVVLDLDKMPTHTRNFLLKQLDFSKANNIKKEVFNHIVGNEHYGTFCSFRETKLAIFEDGTKYYFDTELSEEENLKIASLLGDINKAVITVALPKIKNKDSLEKREPPFVFCLKKPTKTEFQKKETWDDFLKFEDKKVESLVLTKNQIKVIAKMISFGQTKDQIGKDDLEIEDGIILNKKELEKEINNLGKAKLKSEHLEGVKNFVKGALSKVKDVKQSSKNSFKKESKEQKFINN